MRRVITYIIPLPLLLFLGCEKLRTELKDEFGPRTSYLRKKDESKSYRPPVEIATAGKKCCWCVTKYTNENRVMTYNNPESCELRTDLANYSSCRAVVVENDVCSFSRAVHDASGKKIVSWVNEDLKIKKEPGATGPDEFILLDNSLPKTCNRQLASDGSFLGSKDPRCEADLCRCYKDDSLSWNCKLMLFRKDGMTEMLGTQPNPVGDSACSPSRCRELFPKEVNAFCPSVE